MTGRRTPENILSTVEGRVLGGEWPSPEEMRALLDLCAHPEEKFREAALALIFSPPVADEPAHLNRLLRFLADCRPRLDRLPRTFADFLFDAFSFLRVVPPDPSLRALLAGTLKRLGAKGAHPSRALLLGPALHCLGARDLARTRSATDAAALMRCFRIFRKRILSAPPVPPWAETTAADLGPLRRRNDTCRNLPFTRGRWLRALRPLLLPPLRPAPCSEVHTLRHSYWGGFGPVALDYLHALTLRQAEELRSIRDLAVETSRTTRRVVFSWHNATLAAAGGWAFEHLDAAFPSASLFEGFRKAVLQRSAEIQADMEREPSVLQYLLKLRDERLFVPKLTHALWESRVRAGMNAGLTDLWRDDLRSAAEFLDPEAIAEIEAGGKFGRHGAVSSHQHVSVRDVLAWRARDREQFGKGLARLAALAVEGQKLLDAGRLDRLVLPWIDKFFISSRREADCAYLPALVDRLEAWGVRPLVLFWEDTAHACTPSFQIVLKRWKESGHPYHGIGIFGDGTSDREDAALCIREKHREASLFALRPFACVHDPRPLHRLLETRDRGFLKGYDSSWKDGLCFLYAGTRVFPLLSVQCESEPFAAWVACDGAKVPFGTAFRSSLRREIFGPARGPVDPLSLEYALWANLC